MHFLVLIFTEEGGHVSWIILLTVHYWYVGVVYIDGFSQDQQVEVFSTSLTELVSVDLVYTLPP